MSEEQIMDEENKIKNQDFREILSQGFLAYSLSVIADRALPDVRDGLKPVHRRILYAMNDLKLNPTSGFKKCARVVGDVIGKYHPHGDASVYDAMVRLAQNFAVRYPLVDGQGNFGNIDGDSPAAMRYTEARLTDVAMAIMEDISEGTVSFNSTYDGENQEPSVMPCAFPNLLANGAEGIAVGMATKIPPHNVGEISDALLYLIKNPEATIQELMQFIKGPDFPTGGSVIESHENLVKIYETGRGAIKVRANWIKEELPRGTYQIVVTEIPYGVQKDKLYKRLTDLLEDKKFPLVADIREESSDTIRLIIEPKNKNIEPEVIMSQLFKTTDLQINFNLNMNVLDKDHVPGIRSLKEVLVAFLNHRREILINRSKVRLEKINHRLEILDGLLITYLNLDEVIRIIREEDDVFQELMVRFNLTEIQTEAILNMKLRSLRKLEEIQIKNEQRDLTNEKIELQNVLSNEDLQWKKISIEIDLMKKKFGQKTELGKRRTKILGIVDEIDVPLDAFIEKEPITVIISQKGWIRAIKGHISLNDDLKFKEGDTFKIGLHMQTTDKIMLFSTNGRCFTLLADRIPRGRGFGEPIRLSIDLPEEDDILTAFIYDESSKRLVVSNFGKGFIVKESDLLAQTRAGKVVLILPENASAKFCLPCKGDTVAVIGQNRKLLIFDRNEIPEMSKGQGVLIQKYPLGSCMTDIKVFNKEEGLSYPCTGGIRTETNITGWFGHRAQIGKMPPVGFPKTNHF
ncbi:MAG: DNA topoisomerase IV subunit A [Alphaproteobacteria bacterium]|nr:DNA topoisomerase IV subunit A [Alphaproteobacteria bacterium]